MDLFRLFTFKVAVFFTIMPIGIVTNVLHIVAMSLESIAEVLTEVWRTTFIGNVEGACPDCGERHEQQAQPKEPPTPPEDQDGSV